MDLGQSGLFGSHKKSDVGSKKPFDLLSFASGGRASDDSSFIGLFGMNDSMEGSFFRAPAFSESIFQSPKPPAAKCIENAATKPAETAAASTPKKVIPTGMSPYFSTQPSPIMKKPMQKSVEADKIDEGRSKAVTFFSDETKDQDVQNQLVEQNEPPSEFPGREADNEDYEPVSKKMKPEGYSAVSKLKNDFQMILERCEKNRKEDHQRLQDCLQLLRSKTDEMIGRLEEKIKSRCDFYCEQVKSLIGMFSSAAEAAEIAEGELNELKRFMADMIKKHLQLQMDE